MYFIINEVVFNDGVAARMTEFYAIPIVRDVVALYDISYAVITEFYAIPIVRDVVAGNGSAARTTEPYATILVRGNVVTGDSIAIAGMLHEYAKKMVQTDSVTIYKTVISIQ